MVHVQNKSLGDILFQYQLNKWNKIFSDDHNYFVPGKFVFFKQQLFCITKIFNCFVFISSLWYLYWITYGLKNWCKSSFLSKWKISTIRLFIFSNMGLSFTFGASSRFSSVVHFVWKQQLFILHAFDVTGCKCAVTQKSHFLLWKSFFWLVNLKSS